MLDMFGSEYVITHVVAEHNERMRTENYRVYVTDMLKLFGDFIGANVEIRYADIFQTDDDEQKSGDEVALDVIKKLGLKVQNGLHETESDIVA